MGGRRHRRRGRWVRPWGLPSSEWRDAQVAAIRGTGLPSAGARGSDSGARTQRAELRSASRLDTRAGANGVCLPIAELTPLGTFGYVLRLVCLCQCEGAALNRASRQSRPPTLTPARRNARPVNPALPPAGQHTRRLHRSRGPSRPCLTDGYPSLRAKRPSTPLLRGAESGDSPAVRGDVAPATGREPNAELRPRINRGCHHRKRPGNPQLGEVIRVRRGWSSGGLSRSYGGIQRLRLSSIQHGGSAEA